MASNPPENLDDLAPATAADNAAFDELIRAKTVSEVVSKIKGTDMRSAAARNALLSYLALPGVPLLPFGKMSTLSSTISASPGSDLNSTNRPTDEQNRQLKFDDPGYTLAKLSITPTQSTALPTSILRVFFTIGNLLLSGTSKTDSKPQKANYLLVVNPVDSSFWLVQNFYPVDENGIEFDNTKIITLPIQKGKTEAPKAFSLARIANASAALGNATVQLQLDSTMGYAFTANEMKVGGFVNKQDYDNALKAQPAVAAP